MPSGRANYRITFADALSAHRRALESGGGLEGIPNVGMVLSAIGRPYNRHYRFIYQKVAALVQSMATNHGFADGNKRTTVLLMHQLLTKSGYRLMVLPGDGPRDAAVEKLIYRVIDRDISLEELTAWFRARIRKID